MASCIRYHAHCLDGTVSAALVARATGIRRYVPYVHTPPDTFPEHIPDAVGVDIPLLPGMVEWWDHHATGLKFATPEIVRALGAPFDVRAHFDPTAPACATLLPRPPAFDALVAATAQIDSAAFLNPHDACDLGNPVLLTSATIIRRGDMAWEATIITALAETNTEGIAALTTCTSDADHRATHDAWRAYRAIVNARAEIAHDIVTLDLTEERESQGFSALLMYEAHPEVAHAVVLIPERDQVLVSVSRNPWRRDARPVDAIARTLGGGGHAGAAGVTFPPHPAGLASARRTFRMIVTELRESPSPPPP